MVEKHLFRYPLLEPDEFVSVELYIDRKQKMVAFKQIFEIGDFNVLAIKSYPILVKKLAEVFDFEIDKMEYILYSNSERNPDENTKEAWLLKYKSNGDGTISLAGRGLDFFDFDFVNDMMLKVKV